ncbi:hypothetical protein P879_08175 [Paragonimus westermani]|uniref:Uncharacterized protein n=1 Tax=Paragonimus westermani TaxID=34504 RepID=A0A8T0DFE9_9TREM|nr:hypothetical protein P879_08175 [Paragonimus westermani]
MQCASTGVSICATNCPFSRMLLPIFPQTDTLELSNAVILILNLNVELRAKMKMDSTCTLGALRLRERD